MTHFNDPFIIIILFIFFYFRHLRNIAGDQMIEHISSYLLISLDSFTSVIIVDPNILVICTISALTQISNFCLLLHYLFKLIRLDAPEVNCIIYSLKSSPRVHTLCAKRLPFCIKGWEIAVRKARQLLFPSNYGSVEVHSCLSD